jgi:hypothetical protein
VIDFIHVLQYLHQADRVLHGDGEQARTAVAEHTLAVPSGRSTQVADNPDAMESAGLERASRALVPGPRFTMACG